MKRKALFLAALTPGGLERVFYNLYKILNIDNFIVLDERHNFFAVPEDKILGLHSYYPKDFWGQVKVVLSTFWNLRKIKRKYDFSVCISGHEPCNLLNVLTRKNEKVILTFHGNYTMHILKNPFHLNARFSKIKIAIIKWIIKTFYNKADAIVVVSKNIEDDFIKNWGIKKEKIRVIYNPIFFNEIKTKSREDLGKYEKLFSNYNVIINIGRIYNPKGQWYLLKFLKVLKKKHNNLKLVILGDGEMKEFLVEFGKRLGLKVYDYSKDEYNESYDVYFLGFQENPFKFISRSKLFLFPSFFEGLPMVLVEALAAGAVIISSDCRSGPREILAPDTDFNYETKDVEFAKYGILMPVLDINNKEANLKLSEAEKKWVEVIDRMLKDEKLREKYIKLSNQRAKDFDIENIKKEWEKLFEKLEGK
ncbi:MAG: glycosyltransferase [Candidatus Woesearchaeota archaeon]